MRANQDGEGVPITTLGQLHEVVIHPGHRWCTPDVGASTCPEGSGRLNVQSWPAAGSSAGLGASRNRTTGDVHRDQSGGTQRGGATRPWPHDVLDPPAALARPGRPRGPRPGRVPGGRHGRHGHGPRPTAQDFEGPTQDAHEPDASDTDRDGVSGLARGPRPRRARQRYEYLSGTNPRRRTPTGRDQRRPRGRGPRSRLRQHPRYEPTKGTDGGQGRHRSRRHRHGRSFEPARPRRTPVPSHPTPSRRTRAGRPTRRRGSGLPVFPTDNVWNERIDERDVASNSATMITPIGLDSRSAHGLRVVRRLRDPVSTSSGPPPPRSKVAFDYDDESDHVLYPIPASPKIEGGSDGHILMLDKDACRLYELFAAAQGERSLARRRAARRGTSGPTRSGRTAGPAPTPPACRSCRVSSVMTSSRRATIAHALRFTTNRTRTSYIYPARHEAGESSSSSLPPMGLRVRLKASFDTSGFSPQARVIAVALQRYGMILADNGSPWYITGASDPNYR